MQNQKVDLGSEAPKDGWSSRILILAIAGILFLTLYPFRLDVHASLPGGRCPFLLGRSGKSPGSFDGFLNVLLFVPFGFGLAEKLRERGKSRLFTLVVALASGLLFSYCIELLQIYIPQRDSGWDDVRTNGSGSVVGFVLYETLGKFALRCVSTCEKTLESLLTPRRAVAVLLVYFGLWFVASYLLQRKTRLTDWRADALLMVGNDTSGRYAWKGTINAVRIWDLALRDDVARQISSGQPPDTGMPGLLMDFDFSAGPPYRDQMRVSSELAWIPRAPSASDADALVLDGSSWLTTKAAVPDLVANLQKTNQFTVSVVCTPAVGTGAWGKIISIAQPSGVADFYLRQEDASLLFWFRDRLSEGHGNLPWTFAGVFAAARTRNILYSYDGANLVLYVDGHREPLIYRLGPGSGLAKVVRKVKTGELEGYNYIYYILVFSIAGAILGVAARNLAASAFSAWFWMVSGFLAGAILLEWILVSTSGRDLAFSYLGLSILCSVVGFLWVNSDRRTLATLTRG
ncbi:MAG: VanZ family protein [Candidatus Acidiferrales bacterium]